MKKTIAISLSPNTNIKDILAAFVLLFSPHLYKKGDSIRLLEQWFRQFFMTSFVILFSSGRCALFSILKGLDIGKGDSVLLQSFTCVAVPNAVLALGAMPIYVDINDSLTMDHLDLERKITSTAKAIIVQHTFGIPSNMQKIIKVARVHKLPIIEDCAHSLGVNYMGKKLGTIGIASFFSFGRDKTFSSVFGGVAMTNNKSLGKKIRAIQKGLAYPHTSWIIQQLFHPIAFFFILPFYDFFYLGKIMLVIFQKLKLLSFPVTKEERLGKIAETFVKKFPNALASLALIQLKRHREIIGKRMRFAKMYIQEFRNMGFSLPFGEANSLLRFPLFVERREDFINFFKRNNIYLGTWYSETIDPNGTDYAAIFYQRGSCPRAEYLARKIVNFPTHPKMSEKDVKRIIDLTKFYVKNR